MRKSHRTTSTPMKISASTTAVAVSRNLGFPWRNCLTEVQTDSASATINATRRPWPERALNRIQGRKLIRMPSMFL